MTTTLAMSAVLAASGPSSATVPTVESTTERVLQSVKVSMGPDGTTTGVGSSVVRTDGSVEDAETSDEAYSPQEVVGDLPVRVLTSWRTSEGAGTDLSDLQGYSGRIAIDVTVQNLTVKPEMLTYDAAGSSRQQAALVGSPLTVTASTSLGDLRGERVVTDDRGSGVNVTNGVIGRDADGTTVQWAALLAPPILSSSSEFSLVVDAKDFDVPTLDLSVQPGLVTDPSMGGLVDAAFNPANSSELELQQRTIDLIGDVNLVLAKASDTISEVRTNLTSTAETLGTQTVSDLQASTQSVTSNMSALDGALQSLRGDLSSSLESTGSSAIAELDSAVATVDQLLGDTSAQAPVANVRGTGCETTVAAPQKSGSVYGNLLQVTSQLDAYSKATGSCKKALQDSIVRIIGDADVDVDTCEDVTSVTCALFDTRTAFDTAADQLADELNEAVDALEPKLYENAVAAADNIVTQADDIKALTELINVRRMRLTRATEDILTSLTREGTVEFELEGQTLTVPTIESSLDQIETALGLINSDAEEVKDEMIALQEQGQDAAAVTCDLVEQGKLDANDAARIRRELVDYECGAAVPTPVVSTALQDVLDATETDPHAEQPLEGAALALQNARANVAAFHAYLEDSLKPRENEDPDTTLNQLFDALLGENGQFSELEDATDDLKDEIEGIKDLEAKVSNIRTDITTGVETAKGDVEDSLDLASEDIVEVGDDANAELGTMFDRSVSGLSGAADTVVRNGKASVNEQKSAFEKARDASANKVASTVEDGLSQVNTGVTASTRDMEAATTLLIADLRKVLLDLGERRVGGGGLLGAMSTNAATARTADYQLGLAGTKASSYANVRGQDIAGLQLRQAQTNASMQMLVEMPAFQLDLPSGSQHRTVYSFTIGDS